MRSFAPILAAAIMTFTSSAHAAAANTLHITGTPPASFVAGTQYYFRPGITAPSGAKVTFSILRKPFWASFSVNSGSVWGTSSVPHVYNGIAIFASDGKTKVGLPDFSITVKPNQAPLISGTPVLTAQVGTAYSFRPTVTSAADTLVFSIANKPVWGGFDTKTGMLSGAPVAAGVASNIIIGVNNGKGHAELKPFSITVAAAPPGVTTYKLTLTMSGSGTVTDSKGAFACASSCAQMIAAGTSLTLRPSASPGFKFDSWSGACSSNTDCSLVMNGNLAATASFSALVTTPPPVTSPSPPPPPGNGYPGFTYKLPTVRPFISLNQYAGASLSSTAVSRLKAQVDDVVAVTKSQGATTTYDKLVAALYSNHYGFSTIDSVVMFRLTGSTDYIDQAIRMVDLFVTAENASIAAGGTPRIAGDSYLYVGQYLSELALAYDFGYNRLTAPQRAAWSSFAERTVYNVWNPNSATWGSTSRPWSGWSINDPGNNYYYSFLKATQLWALASQNPTWISFLQTQKYTQLVPFFSALTGGGSREGTGYGTAMGTLFEDYAYWKDSTGEDLSGYSTHARDTIDYWIHATVPTFEYFAPIGDQARASMPIMFDYQRKLILEGVALSPTSPQGMRGLWWLSHAKVTDGGNGWVVGAMRYNFDYRYDLLAGSGTAQAPTSLMYGSAGTGALFARSDWSTAASWMHANVGYYDQSHAHQDQGGFSFFKGTWLSLTSNVFSSSGINQGTEVENVLRFDLGSSPVPQNYSVSTKTVADSGDVLQINANLTPAYSNNAKSVSSWTRQFTYQRSAHTLTIHDLCAVGSGVTPVWQLHVPVLPVRQSDGSYLAGSLRIVPVQPKSPVASIVSMKNTSSDFTGGYRLELRNTAGSCEFIVSLAAQ